MKISKKDFLVKAGIDIRGFDDDSVEHYTKSIKGYMDKISIFLLKFAHIEKINMVKLAMNWSEISINQIMLDKFNLYQKLTIKGKSGGCSDTGYLNRALFNEMKNKKVIPVNF
jgi:hypothetical protein